MSGFWILLILLVIAILVIYLIREVNIFEVSNVEMEFENLPPNFDSKKILQVGDLHSKSFGRRNEKLKEAIRKAQPDYVMITGDMVEGEKLNYNIAYDMMKFLTENYRTYYIIGNHEQKSLRRKYKKQFREYFRKISELDMHHLSNSSEFIEEDGQKIKIYGFESPFESYRYLFNSDDEKIITDDFLYEKIGGKSDDFSILLAHNPLYFDIYDRWGADLVLSGHVHGGIIKLPFLGALLSPDRTFFPRYHSGMYEGKKSKMYVTRGLGGSKILVRINSRPELVNIKLKRKDGDGCKIN